VQILQKQGVHHSTLRFSGDSSLLAVASQAKTIWLLDSHSGEVVQQLEGHTQLTNALAFSPDGKTLASSGSDRVLRVWELATGRAIQSVAGAARSFRDAVFADGQTLVTCGADRTIRIWEITEAPAVATGTVTITGHCRHTLQGHSSGIWTVAVDTTSQVVASAGEDCNILLWERSTGRLLHKLQGHRYTVTALAFSPDGQTLVSGSPDQTVRLWNYRSYRPLVELRDDSQSTSVHEQSIWCVALSPDGATVAAGYSDGSIVLWDIRDPTHCRQIGKLRKHAGWVRKVAFSPDGTLLASGSNDQTVRIWDVVTGQLRAECKGHTDWVMSLTFHPDGQRLASAGYDNTIRLWDVATGKPVAPASVTTPVTDPTPMRHNKGVMAVTFHPQGHLLLSASQDERMIFWQVANQQKVQSLIAPGPYSGLNITGVTGLSEAQKAALRALGAVEE
jgi:WD40 repeat protein